MKPSPTYMKHPLITGLLVHKSGKKFKYNNKVYIASKVSQKVKCGRYILSWKVYFNKTSYSPYKLTLEAWYGLQPDDGKRYWARTKSLDKNDLSYTNLYWTTKLSSKFNTFNAGQQNSKLTLEETAEIYRILSNESNTTTKAELGRKYNVSSMSILRAFRRYKNHYLK